MSDEFNSHTTGVHRTAENIKAQWESLKKTAKKVSSSARQSLLQTGGGPAKPHVNDPIHYKIMGLLSTTAVGLINKFDSDNVVIKISDETSENCLPQEEPALAKVSVPDAPRILQPESTISSYLVPSNSADSEEMDYMPMISQDWGDYSTRMLQRPVSSSLRFSNKETSVGPLPDGDDIGNKTPKVKAKPWISKRRPTLPIAAMEELQNKKVKAMEMQMNFAEIEREEAKKMFEIKYETQKEILIQEKLKTRLLKIQIKNAKRKKKRKC